MINKKLDCFIAVISHKRPENIKPITKLIGDSTFYVNTGEKNLYLQAGAKNVKECGDNICQARNQAIKDARNYGLPCIQVSDDLKSIKFVELINNEYFVNNTDFEYVVETIVQELENKNYYYGGIAVTTNRLNYTGINFSYDKLIVNDLVCIMPGDYLFDEKMYLKEDYDMTLTQLLEVGGVVRCNQFLCDFPHRNNKGGANTYRTTKEEHEANMRVYNKWGDLIKKHPNRENQISLNYNKIRTFNENQTKLF